MQNVKTMYIFAGPNGSGKSTIIAEFLRDKVEVFYVCADEISRELSLNALTEDDNNRSMAALYCSEEMVRYLIMKGQTFAYETVLSSQHKWPLFQLAKDNGYHLITLFVTTRDVSINIRRVAARVAVGGHNVPEEKIRKRYLGSMMNLGKLLLVSDELIVFDNSEESDTLDTAKQILHNGSKGLYVNEFCPWIQELTAEWLQEGVIIRRNGELIKGKQATENEEGSA